jgi:hypothetical protein
MDDASPVMTPPSSFRGGFASSRERFNVAALRANAQPAGGCGQTLRADVELLRANVAQESVPKRLSC